MDRDKWSARQEFLCKLLRNIRKESSLTQVQLALKLKRPQTYVSKYELGERRLDLLEIYDICIACDIPLGEFIERAEPEFQKYSTTKE
jgi:transcriptional regulator with XRE-family HTH domain